MWVAILRRGVALGAAPCRSASGWLRLRLALRAPGVGPWALRVGLGPGPREFMGVGPRPWGLLGLAPGPWGFLGVGPRPWGFLGLSPGPWESLGGSLTGTLGAAARAVSQLSVTPSGGECGAANGAASRCSQLLQLPGVRRMHTPRRAGSALCDVRGVRTSGSNLAEAQHTQQIVATRAGCRFCLRGCFYPREQMARAHGTMTLSVVGTAMCQCSALSALSFNTRHTWVNEWSHPRLDQGLGQHKTVLEGSQRSLLAFFRPFWCIHAELCS